MAKNPRVGSRELFHQADALHEDLVYFRPGLCSHVSLHMEGEVVRAGERPFTQVTLKRPVSGVLPEVTRELIRAGELPAAALPAAVVWLLSCKHKDQ